MANNVNPTVNPNQNPSVNITLGGNDMNTMNDNNQNAQPANLDWRNKLQPDILEKVEESENNYFWAGTIVGALVVGGLAVIFDRR